MAFVFAYVAVGGSLGTSGALGDTLGAAQAGSRVAGAVATVVGLAGVAGWWGHRRRFWIPAGLTWIGSGAMAAFDGLALVFFLLLGTDAGQSGWGLTDTTMAIKVVIGLAAGAVGARAVVAAAAAKDDRVENHHLAGRQRGAAAGDVRHRLHLVRTRPSAPILPTQDRTASRQTISTTDSDGPSHRAARR
jgi:hypothetical protein